MLVSERKTNVSWYTADALTRLHCRLLIAFNKIVATFRESEWCPEACGKFAELVWQAQNILAAEVTGYKKRSIVNEPFFIEDSVVPCIELYDIDRSTHEVRHKNRFFFFKFKSLKNFPVCESRFSTILILFTEFHLLPEFLFVDVTAV